MQGRVCLQGKLLGDNILVRFTLQVLLLNPGTLPFFGCLEHLQLLLLPARPAALGAASPLLHGVRGLGLDPGRLGGGARLHLDLDPDLRVCDGLGLGGGLGAGPRDARHGAGGAGAGRGRGQPVGGVGEAVAAVRQLGVLLGPLQSPGQHTWRDL